MDMNQIQDLNPIHLLGIDGALCIGHTHMQAIGRDGAMTLSPYLGQNNSRCP